MPDKQDSNVVALHYCEEDSIGVVSGDEVWYDLSPNSYNDFGAEITTVARNVIRQDRQNLKGVTVDLDASGGFNIDLTQNNLIRLMQGFFVADITEKGTTGPLNGTATAITAVDTVPTDDQYEAASGLDGIGLLAESLIWCEGFTNSGNNGVKRVKAVAAAAIDVYDTLTAEASPPAAATIHNVGYQFASGTLDVVVSGDLPVLTRASGSVDFTTLGVSAGDWLYIGSDEASTSFVNSVNNGFVRVSAVAATGITLDKSSGTMVVETGSGLTIRMYYGNRLLNDPLGSAGSSYNRRTWQLERQLGSDGGGTQSEYLVGSVANEMTINIANADKVTVDMNFVCKDHETQDGATGIKAGTRPTATDEDALNSTSDFSRLRMHIINTTNEYPSTLFAYITDLTLNLSNGVTPNKAVSVLGAFDMSSGNFDITGSATAYFNDVDSIAAVRNNSDVTLDFAIVKSNAGLLFDIPLVALGDGRLDVQLNEPIVLPLEMSAAKHSTLNYTLLMTEFKYLPTVAG